MTGPRYLDLDGETEVELRRALERVGVHLAAVSRSPLEIAVTRMFEDEILRELEKRTR